MLRWSLRIVGGLLALIVIATLCCAIAYAMWLPSHERNLREGSRIAGTRLGDVEYATAGEGTPILRIHGSPGGYDHSIRGALARPRDIAGFKVIAPSRPGYLRTPLRSGETPARQADLYAALLDELGIERTIVWAVSGGGPSALQFATRHPQRTMGLVLIVPMLQSTHAYRGSMQADNASTMLLQDFGSWLGVQLMGRHVAAATMPKLMPGFDASDPLHMTLMREIGLGFIPARLRAAGRQNDIAQYGDLGIEALPLESLAVPVLIVHGTADENAPYSGSAAVAKRISQAELVTIEGGDHFIIITRAREISERTMRFMQEIAKAQFRPASAPPP